MRSKSKLVAATVAAVGSLGLTIGATAIAQVGGFPGSQGDVGLFNDTFNNAFNQFSEGHFGTYCNGSTASDLGSLLNSFGQLAGDAGDVVDNYMDNACTSDGGTPGGGL